jgi:hypothetical protein
VATAGAELEWWRSNADEPLFYEPSRDTLLESRGDRVVRTSVVVAHESVGPAGRRLLVGVNHRTSHVPGVPAADVDRPGLLAAWTLGDRRLGLREPTLLVNLFYYRADPYKKDEPGLNVGVRLRLGR